MSSIRRPIASTCCFEELQMLEQHLQLEAMVVTNASGQCEAQLWDLLPQTATCKVCQSRRIFFTSDDRFDHRSS